MTESDPAPGKPSAVPAECPQCGQVLPADAPEGACPRCLLAAFRSGETPTSDDEAATLPLTTGPGAGGAEDADAWTDSFSGSFRPGTVIGPFRLVEKLGEGGFGVVWKAEQSQPFKRTVALKLIKPGFDSAEIVARFALERQALAVMDHPHIARVYDAGATTDGRPYFVMEWVDGRPLTQFCDGERMSIRERLELFELVCHAVQHAHQKGVIHRDLKPSNILVIKDDQGRPVPKVIDFGIAKALFSDLGEGDLTRSLNVIGTPVYMSPEQATGSADIDTRSDLYSLGVILYELLTGEPPLDQKALVKRALDEILRLIREEEPKKPSTKIGTFEGETQARVAQARGTATGKLQLQLRGDLDWIVLKALAKEREQRYGTATALADDIRRHLAGVPVEAAPPGAVYRVRKFVQRNRVLVASGLALFITLAAGIGVSTWQAIRATRAESDAREKGGAALAARDLARDEAARAKIAVEKQLELIRAASRHSFDSAVELAEAGDLPRSVAHLSRALAFDPDNRVAANYLGNLLIWSSRGLYRKANPAFSAFEPFRLLDASSGKLLLASPADAPTLALTVVDLDTAAAIGTPIELGKTSIAFGSFSISSSGPLITEDPNQTDELFVAALHADGSRILTMKHKPTGRKIRIEVWKADGIKMGGAEIDSDQDPSHELSDDGSRLILGTGRPRTLQLFDVESGLPLGDSIKESHEKSYRGTGRYRTSPGRDIFGVSFHSTFSPDGRRFVTVDNPKENVGQVRSGQDPPRGVMRRWDGETGSALGSPEFLEGRVFSVEFSKDSRWMVLGVETMESAWIEIRNAESGERIRKISDESPIYPLQILSDNKTLLTSIERHGNDGKSITMALTSLTDGQPVGEPMRSYGSGTIGAPRFALSPDHRRLVGIGHDRFSIWELPSCRLVRETAPREEGIGETLFSLDGEFLWTLASGGERRLRLWNCADGRLVSERIWPQPVSQLGTAGTSTIAIADRIDFSSREGRWHCITMGTGFPASISLPYERHTTPLIKRSPGRFVMREMPDRATAIWSPEGKQILQLGTMAQDDSRHALLWTFPGLEKIGSPMRLPDGSHRARAIFSPDSSRCATFGTPGGAIVWDTATGSRLCGPLDGKGVESVDFSPDGSLLVTWPPGSNKVNVWGLPEGAPISRFPLFDPRRHWEKPSNESSQVAPFRCLRATPHFSWWMPRGEATLHLSWNSSIELGPTGIGLTSGPDRDFLMDYTSGTVMGFIPNHTRRVFSPCGRWLATGGEQGKVSVWNVQGASLVGTELECGGDVEYLAFSADGESLVSVSRGLAADTVDISFQLWDVATSRPLCPPVRDGKTYSSALPHPTDDWILTSDGSLWGLMKRHCVPVPPWVEDLAAWSGGERLGVDGNPEILDVAELRQLESKLRSIKIGQDPWSDLLRWILDGGRSAANPFHRARPTTPGPYLDDPSLLLSCSPEEIGEILFEAIGGSAMKPMDDGTRARRIELIRSVMKPEVRNPASPSYFELDRSSADLIPSPFARLIVPTSPDEFVPDPHTWKRVSPGYWEERNAYGDIVEFLELGEIRIEGNTGMLLAEVRRGDSDGKMVPATGSLQIFIPNLDTGAKLAIRNRDYEGWTAWRWVAGMKSLR